MDASKPNLPTETLADILPSSQDTGGTPMILFARPQSHAHHQAQSVIGLPAGVPNPRTRTSKSSEWVSRCSCIFGCGE
jgi:hypothetical protein